MAPKKTTTTKKTTKTEGTTAVDTAIPSTSGLGLDAIGDLSSLLDAAPPAANGKPLEIELDRIIEDPEQPRRSFDPATLQELAASIKARGVKTPISVRPHPEDEGKFVINHGARRFRASLLAQSGTIPAYIDTDYNRADQVIENLHRDGLTAREIADFIGREVSTGKSKGDIARDLHKSAAFVSQHVTLLDLPDPIAELFNSGRCNDVTVINELVRVYKKDKEAVAEWLANESQDITRGTVKVLKEWVDSRKGKGKDAPPAEDPTPPGQVMVRDGDGPWTPANIEDEQGEAPEGQDADQIPMFPEDGEGADRREQIKGGLERLFEEEAEGTQVAPTVVPPVRAADQEQDEHDPEKFRKAIVCITFNDRPARLVLTRRPSTAGLGWIKFDDDGSEEEVALDLVVISYLIEG
ncbi:ParB family chromosome partitioning protein [Azospirillum brasilense]|nr:ParB family chromosome partitioning protein [Azospirillum brasilense]